MSTPEPGVRRETPADLATVLCCRKLSAVAFGDMNPFPRRLLRNRRALHLERLQGELQQLAEQQEEFVTERAERKDKDLDTAASEDDELGVPAGSEGIAAASEGTPTAGTLLSG